MVRILEFWKMHGLGNDYIVMDNRDQKIEDEEMSVLAKRLSERRFGIGANGLLLACKSIVADVKMRIFNSDGTEAEMCGNGIRCLAKFCFENEIVKRNPIRVETLAGIRETWLDIKKGYVRAAKVNVGKPQLKRGKIPMYGKGTFINKPISVNRKKFWATCLSLGNPHCIIFVDTVDSYPISDVGPKIERHKFFPNRVNVEFVQIISRKKLRVKTWERGVGETLACGTGACASAVAANLLGKTENKVTVHLLGGDLKIEYINNTVFMKGPVEKVFEGRINLP
ncbi:MAG: diaminopimelate epimerase [Candidatus Bathycorpusculaceae bacterium]